MNSGADYIKRTLNCRPNYGYVIERDDGQDDIIVLGECCKYEIQYSWEEVSEIILECHEEIERLLDEDNLCEEQLERLSKLHKKMMKVGTYGRIKLRSARAQNDYIDQLSELERTQLARQIEQFEKMAKMFEGQV